MGLLGLIFGNKEKSYINNMLAVINSGIEKKTTDSLFVHKDIEDLIWVADGIRKNYTSYKKQDIYEFEGVKITFSSMQQDEPSLIYTKLPIEQVDDFKGIERPPYYPSYSQLTPLQKGLYWKLLANPYNPNIDIGFVFILYYGLERHLLNGDYEKAFRVIIKLRDTYANKSFQSYSANALILTCLCKQRADLAFEFMQSLDKDYELQFSDNLFILCKYSLDIPLISKDIMRLAKSFEFSNINYIKNYPEMFEEILLGSIRNKYKQDSILVRDFITQAENKKARKQSVSIFANMSIIDKSIEVPMIIEIFKFKKAMYDLLETTNNQVKIKIAQLRKNGELEEKKEKPKKTIEILSFDEEAERELLMYLSKAKNNFSDRHFALISLQDFYYKYRDTDNKYLEKCIEYCYIDINDLEQMQKSYFNYEVSRIKQFAFVYSKKEMDREISEIGKFDGNIPAFKRLAIIFEKQKDFEKAIEICNMAINYYRSLNLNSNVDEFKTRIDKLKSKI